MSESKSSSKGKSTATPTAASTKKASPAKKAGSEKKPDASAAAASDTPVKKPSSTKKSGSSKPPQGTKVLPTPAEVTPPPTIHPALPGTKKIQKVEILELRKALVEDREELLKVIQNLHSDALEQAEGTNLEEDGTEIFSQLVNLNSASDKELRIRQIDEAIRAIDEGHYGNCSMCGRMINPERLRALPSAKTCIRCQSELDAQNSGRVSYRGRL